MEAMTSPTWSYIGAATARHRPAFLQVKGHSLASDLIEFPGKGIGIGRDMRCRQVEWRLKDLCQIGGWHVRREHFSMRAGRVSHDATRRKLESKGTIGRHPIDFHGYPIYLDCQRDGLPRPCGESFQIGAGDLTRSAWRS